MTALTERLQVYGRLMRLEKPIGTLLLLWPTLWGLWIASNGRPPLLILLTFVLGTFLMRSAGCVINDYADRHFDGKVDRTNQRPFAQGQTTEKEALLLAAGLSLVAFAMAYLTLNRFALLLSVPAVFLAATYPFTKRFFPIPQAYLGIAFSFGIPMAFAAVLNEIPWYAWLMLIANTFWTIGYDTSYAMADKPDDLRLGLKSSAITFGRFDAIAVLICQLIFIILMMAIGYGLHFSATYFFILILLVGYCVQQYHIIKQRDRQLCFKAFLQNNRIGLAVFIGIALQYIF